MTDLVFLKQLESLGVSFSVTTPNPWGQETHQVSPEHLMEILQDSMAFHAKLNGVSKSQYIGWITDNFSVRCSGTTGKGKPCKGLVPSGSNVTAKQWVALQGEYCVSHSEGTNG